MAISNSDGSIILTTKVDTSGLQSGMAGMKSGANSLGQAFGKLGTILGAVFSLKAIGQYSKKASDLATETEASTKRLVDIYGEASSAVGSFIDQNARAIGMSKSAAAGFSAVYGNLFSVWADQSTNAALTTKYLNMTAVVASKTGRTMEDVQERIRSGLLGNTEAVEDLGIFVNIKTIEMTDAFKRLADGRSWAQLTANEQFQVRTMAILEQATQKYGLQVAQTSALVKSQFSASLQDLMATIGKLVNKFLIPLMQIGTKAFNMLNSVIQKLFQISGKTMDTAQTAEEYSDSIAEAVENQDALTESVKETAKAQEKALAGFDELNIISSTDDSKTSETSTKPTAISDISGLTIQPTLGDTSETESKASAFADRMKKIFEPIAKPLERIGKIFKDNFDPFYKNVLKPLGAWGWDVFSDTIDTIGDGFESIADSFEALEKPLTNFWNDTLVPIFESLGGWVLDIVKSAGDAFEDWGKSFKENGEEIANIIEFIGFVFQLIWSVIKPIIDSAVKGIKNVLKTTMNFISNIVSAIGNFIGFLKNAFLMIKSAFEGNTEDTKKYAKKALASFINLFIGIGNAIISVINNLWSLIFDSFKGTVNAIGGLISKVGSFFGAKWDLKWDATAPLIPLIPKYVPKLAKGAVIPANREFLAVLGDQKNGRNLEAPEDLIRQIVREETGNQNFTITANGSLSALIRLLNLEIKKEQNRSSVF